MKKKGQVWVETVIYTIIGLALIGLVLSIITPRINERQNRIIVEQSIESLEGFDIQIKDVIRSGEGNVRSIPAFQLREGEFYIDSPRDSIFLTLDDLSTAYSEPGVSIPYGVMVIRTEETGNRFRTTLLLNYSDVVDITFNEGDTVERVNTASRPYQFRIENAGEGVIDISFG